MGAAMMDSVKKAVIRTFYPRDSVRSVLFGPIRGTRFKVAPESSMGASFALGFEAFQQRWFARHVLPGMRVFDIGANRGQTALHFAKYVGPAGAVDAFEPVPQLYDDLALNVRLNNLANVVTHRLAIGKCTGREEFGFDEGNPTAGKIVDCEPGYNDAKRKNFLVEVVALDDFCRDRPVPDFLKIDVEGAARLVLEGAAELLTHHSPRIYIEQHGPEEQQAIKQLLLQRGYRAETLAGESVPDPTQGWHNPLWCTR